MNPLALGIDHFNAGRFEQALRCFRGPGASGPEAGCFAAHALDSLGRPLEAIEAFAGVAAAFPLHAPAYDGLAGLILRRAGAVGEGPALRRILALRPRDARARKLLAGALSSCARAFDLAGRLEPAEAALRRLLAVEPENAGHRAGLVALLRRRAQASATARDLAAAEADLRDALALAPSDGESRRLLSDLLRLRAHEQMSAMKLGPAERSLRAAVAVSPRDARSRGRLGELLRRRATQSRSAGELARAERSLRAALALQPRDAKTRHRLVELLGLRAREFLAAGRGDLAERSLRRALEIAPRDKESRGRLLALLHARAAAAGRPGAAEGILRRALALAPASLETRRLLGELLRERLVLALDADDAAAAERALRGALSLFGRDARARRRLAEPLRARGQAALFARRLRAAGRLFLAVLRCDALDPAAWLSLAAVRKAAGRGREEKAFLRRAAAAARRRRAPGAEFKALMKLGRYREAVAAAERVLDGKPGLPDIRGFWDPWEWDERVPRATLLRELRRFERALGPGYRGPWLHYYRGFLSGPAGLAHFERLADFPAKRYGWMYFRAGEAALMALRFEKAAEWFRRALAGEPADWRARCFLAECWLCLRRPGDAFKEMDRALREAPESERGQVLAWRGAFELWLGRYRKALALLDEAAALGAQCAFCWRGAALLKLGRTGEALAELDRTLRLYPLDFEAYVWRGEAKRALGLNREALEDLDERAAKGARRATPVWLWARFNRALAKAALGDEAGRDAEFAAIPADVIAHIRARTGLARPEDILEAGLRLARGFRRDEYGQAIWRTDRA